MEKSDSILYTHLPARGYKWIVHDPVATHKDVGEPGTDLTCRIWSPDGDGPFPVLVMIHGGGFGNGEPMQWDSWGREMARQGFVVLATRYRRRRDTEGGSFPTFITDNLACIKWLAAHKDDYKADIENVALVGSSAGAAIALWITLLGSDTAYTPEYSPYKDEPVNIRACVAYYPAWTWAGGKETVTEALELKKVPPLAPIILIHGTSDTIVKKDDSDLLHSLLDKAGTDHIYLEYDKFPHAYAYQFPGRENLLTLADVLPLLRNVMPMGKLVFSGNVPDHAAELPAGFHLIRDPDNGNRVIVR